MAPDRETFGRQPQRGREAFERHLVRDRTGPVLDGSDRPRLRVGQSFEPLRAQGETPSRLQALRAQVVEQWDADAWRSLSCVLRRARSRPASAVDRRFRAKMHICRYLC